MLPRIKAEIQVPGGTMSSLDNDTELDDIHFKGDSIYQHNIMRVNYTTYDVRRAQDTINPNTDHHDIITHSFQDPSLAGHQYLYARVLGISTLMSYTLALEC